MGESHEQCFLLKALSLARGLMVLKNVRLCLLSALAALVYLSSTGLACAEPFVLFRSIVNGDRATRDRHLPLGNVDESFSVPGGTDKFNSLQAAIAFNDAESVRLLLEFGADLQAADGVAYSLATLLGDKATAQIITRYARDLRSWRKLILMNVGSRLSPEDVGHVRELIKSTAAGEAVQSARASWFPRESEHDRANPTRQAVDLLDVAFSDPLRSVDLSAEEMSQIMFAQAGARRTWVFDRLSLRFPVQPEHRQHLFFSTASRGTASELSEVLKRGVDPKAKSSSGEYAIQLIDADEEKLDVLLGAGVSPAYIQPEEPAPLWKFVAVSNSSATQKLLSAGASPADLLNGGSLLELAAVNIDDQVFLLLLKYMPSGWQTKAEFLGILPKVTRGLLLEARRAFSQRVASILVKALIDSGASLDGKDFHGDTALSVALRAPIGTSANVIAQLIRAGVASDPVFIAAVERRSESLLTLLSEVRAKPPGDMPDGSSFLHRLYSSDGATIDVFLSLWSHLRPTDADDFPYAALAARSRSSRALRLLKSLGVDLSKPDATRRNAFAITVESNDIEIFKVLLELGVPLESVDDNGNTAFHLLAMSMRSKTDLVQFRPLLRFLVASSLDFKLANKDGNTARKLLAGSDAAQAFFSSEVAAGSGRPVHTIAEAVLESRIDILRKLVSSGANLNETDAAGRTPLRVALESGEFEAAKILVDAKSKISVGHLSAPQKADVDFAIENEAFAKLLLPAILDQQLVTDPVSPEVAASRLSGLVNSSKSPNVSGQWKIKCFNDCRGTVPLNVAIPSSVAFHVSLHSIDADEPPFGRRVEKFVLMQTKAAPVTARMVMLGRPGVLGPFDFTATLEATIEECAVRLSAPNCFPLASLSNLSQEQLNVVQSGSGLARTLAPGEHLSIDLSEGKIDLFMATARKGAVEGSFSLTTPSYWTDTTKQDDSRSSRARFYVALAKIRAEVDDLELSTDPAKQSRRRALVVLQNNIATLLAAKDWKRIIRALLAARRDDILSADATLFDLLRLANVTDGGSAIDRALLIQKIKTLIGGVDPASKVVLSDILSFLEAERDARKSYEVATRSLRERILKQTESLISEFQLLVLEAKEHFPISELEPIFPKAIRPQLGLRTTSLMPHIMALKESRGGNDIRSFIGTDQ